MSELFLSVLGFFLLLMRLRGGHPQSPTATACPNSDGQPSPLPVSIVIPARNESPNILRVLESMLKLTPKPLEVIVVDDESSDDTYLKAQQFGTDHPDLPLKLIRGVKRPAPDLRLDKDSSAKPWNGKQWACHQGALAAQGQYILFTDADTYHHPYSLRHAVDFVESRRLDLMSALPFHECQAFWEKLLGPFQVFLLGMTNPFGDPTPKHLFAIGQYLLFEKEAYFAVGGHSGVRSALVEDIPLAQKIIAKNPKAYAVYDEFALFSVRMYPNFREFFRGWRRNFRAGFEMTSPWLGLEAFLYVAALTGTGHLFRDLGPSLVALMTMLLLTWQQARFGRFSIWGPILFPVSLAVFCAVTLGALMDKVLGRDQKWKGRHYNPHFLKTKV